MKWEHFLFASEWRPNPSSCVHIRVIRSSDDKFEAILWRSDDGPEAGVVRLLAAKNLGEALNEAMIAYKEFKMFGDIPTNEQFSGVLSVFGFWGSGQEPDGGTYTTEYEFNCSNSRIHRDGDSIMIVAHDPQLTVKGVLPPAVKSLVLNVDVTLRTETSNSRLHDMRISIRNGDFVMTAKVMSTSE